MRYVVFGVGRIGRVHARILMAQGQEIVALGDESDVCVTEAANELELLQVPRFSSASAMAAACKQLRVEAAVIASHTFQHARDGLPFLKAGIPVYMEKPLTSELAEAFEFVAQIGTTNHRLIQVGLQRRFDDALVYAKSLLRDNVIGRIREVRCVLRDQYPPPPTYTSRGLIIDMGVHVADEAVWLLDEFPTWVTASVHTAIEYDSCVDEGGNTAFVLFGTASNVIGRLDLSRTHSSGYNNETYIIGTRGTIHVGRFAGYPGPIAVEVWTEQGTLHPSSRSFDMTHLKRPFPEFLPRFQKAYEAAHADFRRVLACDKAEFRVHQSDVLDAQVFVEAAHLSATRMGGRTVKLARSDDLTDYRRLCQTNGLLS